MLDNTQTQATTAIARLKSELVHVDDNGCWNSYDHVLICHGCGEFHTVRSQFIGSSLGIGFRFTDRSQLCIPAYKCGKCSGDTIRNAWEKGMSRTAYNSAAAKIGAELRPEPQPCRLCGSTTGRLDDSGAHCLCAARVNLGLPVPAL